jgi:hypothetical protein
LINLRPLFVTTLLFVLFSSAVAGPITVVAVGDIMMGSDYPRTMLPPNQGNDLYRNVTEYLRSADLTVGNLEGVLLDGGVCAKKTNKGRVYAFRMPPPFAQHLVDAGFDFLNLANNHLNDFGAHGVESTEKTLTDYYIAFGGPAGKIGEFEIRGKNIAIVCFATSPGTDLIFDIVAAQRKVAGLARQHDIVIVSFHGGGEGLKYLHTYDTFEYFLDQPRGNVVEFSRAVVDSGADFVWGHGPHVPRAMEIYKDRLIAYSLGNFCTWGFNVAQERGYAPILKVLLDSAGTFMRGEIFSVVQQPPQPLMVDSLHRAARLIARLSMEDFSRAAPLIAPEGTVFRSISKPVRTISP